VVEGTLRSIRCREKWKIDNEERKDTQGGFLN